MEFQPNRPKLNIVQPTYGKDYYIQDVYKLVEGPFDTLEEAEEALEALKKLKQE